MLLHWRILLSKEWVVKSVVFIDRIGVNVCRFMSDVQASILARRHANLGLEHAAKVGTATVAEPERDLLQRDGFIAQQVKCMDELLLADIR